MKNNNKSKAVSKAVVKRKEKAVVIRDPIGGSSTLDRISNIGKTSIVNTQDGIRIRGRELLGKVSDSTGGSYTGFIGFVQDLAPAGWEYTRLQKFAQLYEKFRFHRVRVHYVPLVGTTTAGQVALFYERDPQEAIPDPRDHLSTIMAYENSVMGSIWAPLSLDFQCLKDEKTYWFSSAPTNDIGDLRLMSQAKIACAVTVPTAPTSGTVYGHMVIDYDVEFVTPELEFDSNTVPYQYGQTANHITMTATTQYDPLAIPQNIFGYTPSPGGIVECLLSTVASINLSNPAAAEVVEPGHRLYLAQPDTVGDWHLFTTLQDAVAFTNAVISVSNSFSGGFYAFARSLLTDKLG